MRSRILGMLAMVPSSGGWGSLAFTCQTRRRAVARVWRTMTCVANRTHAARAGGRRGLTCTAAATHPLHALYGRALPFPLAHAHYSCCICSHTQSTGTRNAGVRKHACANGISRSSSSFPKSVIAETRFTCRFCPEERCFAFDIHKHEFGECWLKFQKGDDPPYTRPKDPHEGHNTYPEIMRHAPRKIWPWAVAEDIWTGPMPKLVPWMSGVVAPPEAQIVSSPPNDKWRERWCKKHGPCD